MPQPRLKAPGGDGEILALPPLSQWPALIEQNAKKLAAAESRGLLPSDCRRNTPLECGAAASQFAAELGLPEPPPAQRPVIVTGHQPELYHPGVWLKNFAAHQLATWVGGSSFNLVVDTDLAKTASLRFPNPTTGLTEEIPFDSPAPPQPYEEWRIRDPELFRALPTAVANRYPCAGTLLPLFWRCAVKGLTQQQRLTELFTGARVQLEAQLDCANRELFLSVVPNLISFITFTSTILARLPLFVEIHNSALHNYRRRHRLRSRSHPVPDLERDGEWLEAPLWAWQPGSGQRQRVFVRPVSGAFCLRAGKPGSILPLELPNRPGPAAFSAWWQLQEAGWKLRSRALLTTLYARLCLADFFIHGLGGGLYDEMTDEIIQAFFGFEPPAYAILTATLRLPDPRSPAAKFPPVTKLRRILRDTYYNPDRHLSSEVSSATLGLVEKKQDHIRYVPPTKPDRHTRFTRLHELNEQLRPKAEAERAQVEAELQAALAQQTRMQTFADREYAFVLHTPLAMQELVTKLKQGLRNSH